MVTADEIVDRALTRGASALTEAELLAMLLIRGQPGESPLAKARNLLDNCGGLQGLLTCDASIARAQELDRHQAAALLSAVELSRRLAHPDFAAAGLDEQHAAARYIHLLFGRVNQMVLGAIFLDIHNRPVGHVDAFRGIHLAAVMEPRPILREAIRRNAHGIIVFQARPSGDPKTSEADFDWAARMRKACELVDLELLDYLVLGGERWTSIRRSRPW